MSRFKSLLGAGLLVSLLSFACSGATFAQTVNTESAGTASSALRGPEQRVALVIGNSNYQNAPHLENPDDDAQSMAQLLNSAGFEVIAATDLTQNDMLKVVQDFSAKVAARGPNTVAMVYYAGTACSWRAKTILSRSTRKSPHPPISSATRSAWST